MTLLKHDHEKVKKLFKSINGSESEKEEIFDKIRSALEIHTMIEEEIFYPAVAQAKSEQAKSVVKEAKEEHAQVKKILGKMEHLEPSDDDWEIKLKELEQDVNHHVQEEEGEMFPEARKDLTDSQLSRIGEQLSARKQQLEKKFESGRMGGHTAHASPK
jgi:iron-sulfur cluster repair protein YtfE (RIC family)